MKFKFDKIEKEVMKLGKQIGQRFGKRTKKGGAGKKIAIVAAVGVGLSAIAGVTWFFARKGGERLKQSGERLKELAHELIGDAETAATTKGRKNGHAVKARTSRAHAKATA